MRTERRILVVANHLVWLQTRLLEGIIDFASLHARWQIDFVPPRPDEWLLEAASRCDGILGLVFSEEAVGCLRKFGKPMVNVVGSAPPDLPCVNPDDRAVGAMAAAHLHSRGYRQLAFCGIRADWSLDRQEGFAAHARRLGITPHALECCHPTNYWDEQEAAPRLLQWIRELPKPVGILCCNDDMAEWVLRQAQAAEMRVPADVAVVGVDNNTVRCSLGAISLSSVDPDHRRIAFEAADLLHRLIEGGSVPQTRIFTAPSRVIARASSSWASTGNEPVDEAIAYIHGRGGVDITVDQVCEASGSSRRTLERLFRERLHTGIAAEISKARLENARRLVLDTSLPLADIASRLEFTCVSTMIHGYRRRFGVPPVKDRQMHRELNMAAVGAEPKAAAGQLQRKT